MTDRNADRDILARMDTFHDFNDISDRTLILKAMNDCTYLKDEYFSQLNDPLLNKLLNNDAPDVNNDDDVISSKFEKINPGTDDVLYILSEGEILKINLSKVLIPTKNKRKREDLKYVMYNDKQITIDKQYEYLKINGGWMLKQKHESAPSPEHFMIPTINGFFVEDLVLYFYDRENQIFESTVVGDLEYVKGVWKRTVTFGTNTKDLSHDMIDVDDGDFFTNKLNAYDYNHYAEVYLNTYTPERNTHDNHNALWDTNKWKTMIKPHDILCLLWDFETENLKFIAKNSEIVNTENVNYWLQMHDVVVVDCDYGSYKVDHTDNSSSIQVVFFFPEVKRDNFQVVQLHDNLYKKIYSTGWSFIENKTVATTATDINIGTSNGNTSVIIKTIVGNVQKTTNWDKQKIDMDFTGTREIKINDELLIYQRDKNKKMIKNKVKVTELDNIKFDGHAYDFKDGKNQIYCFLVSQPFKNINNKSSKIVAKYHDNNNSDESNDNPIINGGWVNLTLNQDFGDVINSSNIQNQKYTIVKQELQGFESKCILYFESRLNYIGYQLSNKRDNETSWNTVFLNGTVKCPNISSSISSITLPNPKMKRSTGEKENKECDINEKYRNVMDHLIEAFFSHGKTQLNGEIKGFKTLFYLVDTGDLKYSNRFLNIWSIVNEWDSSNDSQSKHFSIKDKSGFPFFPNETDEMKYIFHKFNSNKVSITKNGDNVMYNCGEIKGPSFAQKNSLRDTKGEIGHIYTTIEGLRSCITGETISALDKLTNKAPYAIDIKRSGDALQVIRAKSLNESVNSDGSMVVFVTIDKLAFLHARILKTPAILINSGQNMITMFSPYIQQPDVVGGDTQSSIQDEYSVESSMFNRIINNKPCDKVNMLYKLYLSYKWNNISDVNRLCRGLICFLRKIFPNAFGLLTDYKNLKHIFMTLKKESRRGNEQQRTILYEIIDMY